MLFVCFFEKFFLCRKSIKLPRILSTMRAFIVLSCLALAAARPEAGYSYSRPGGSGGHSTGLSGISGSSFGIGHSGGSFGNSFSSGGSSSISGLGVGGVLLFTFQNQIHGKLNKKKVLDIDSKFLSIEPIG